MSIDPALSSEQLAALAAEDPSSWDAILAHPAVYPDLVAWIESARAAQAEGSATAPEVAEPPADPAPGSGAELVRVDPFVAAPEAAPEPAREDRPARPSRLPAVLLGVALGVVAGATLSAALILVVLPGLFGGGVG